ncbi:hypothetical protein O0S08_25020 [Nannocystis poenicansa]|uniref:Uncharacterized protein n=1 Tax=Nannocystis punicea TaxID=2995304 RepID=A0ABY7HJS6_9BACT|nr:hypothetical protein [Nannocystis poenicansa]WAS99613.1 hypothetical protein O0S08_25020 [Nannocystis poenicansa]
MQLGEEGLRARELLAGERRHAHAGVGEPQLPTLALVQRRADLLAEAGDPLEQGGLRQSDDLRRAGEVEGLGEGHERAQQLAVEYRHDR